AEGFFAGALSWTGHKKVVYHESHDEAGNSAGSQRTIRVAVNGASLEGLTRRYAEARCRLVFGTSVLAAATPKFLMGEEIGAQKPHRCEYYRNTREALRGDRHKSGKNLFRFYQEVIRLRLDHPGLRSREVDVLYSHDANRVLAFRRWSGSSDFLILA